MRSIVWLGSGLAALLILVAAVIGLRGTAPDRAARPVAATPSAASTAPTPPAPTSASPAAAVAPLPRPSFDIVTIDPHGQAVLAGRAAPGDRVKVLDGDRLIGEVTADERGEWVLLPDAPIAVGNRELALQATGPDGGPARRSADVVALSVTPAPSGNGAPSALAVLLPGDASRPARILQRPEAGAEAPPLALDAVETGAHDRVVLSGHAAPEARIAVFAGDRRLGMAIADAAGKWSLTAAPPGAGQGELRLDQLAADGSIALSVSVPFTPSAGGAPAAGGDTYLVQRGNSLWRIARQVYGNGARYTVIYRANREQIDSPDRIFPGQQFKLPKS